MGGEVNEDSEKDAGEKVRDGEDMMHDELVPNSSRRNRLLPLPFPPPAQHAKTNLIPPTTTTTTTMMRYRHSSSS